MLTLGDRELRYGMDKKTKEKLAWIIEVAEGIRLLEVLPVKGKAKLTAYLDDNSIHRVMFDSYEEAKKFVTRKVFNEANKEIHSK